MTHGSLFSGIGGFDLAAEWAGWTNVFHCEINPFGQKVLKYYWPKAISYDDITKTDFTIHRGTIDILTGGFPCQPFSLAGKRLGTEDHRNLWPEYFRAIKEIQPVWVVGENVPGIINWSAGLVFEQVQADLESEGYEVWPVILPACGVNAPHKRERVWFVAYTDSNGHELRGLGEDRPTQGESESQQKERQWLWSDDRGACEQGITSNTTSQQSERLQPEQREFSQQEQRQFRGTGGEMGYRNATNPTSLRQPSKEHRQEEPGWIAKTSFRDDWQNFPTQSPICSGNDGISSRLDGITFPKWRNESIKAAGNAIVPQVAYQIFRAINEFVI